MTEQAIEKDPNEPVARCVAALAASYRKGSRPSQSRNRNRAEAQSEPGAGPQPARHVLDLFRTAADAIPEIEQAMRIDPAMSGQFLHFLGLAYLMAEKYETAAALLRQRTSSSRIRIFPAPF